MLRAINHQPLKVKIINPQVTAIIVNYNAGKALLDAVNSVLVSKCVKNVIVLDNGSSDASMINIKIVAENDSRLICINNGKNLGFSKACNIGARKADSDYILFLNPDCILHLNTLEKMLSIINLQTDTGIVGPYLLNDDGSEQAGGRRAVPTPWRSLVRIAGFSFLSKRYPHLFSDFNLHKEPLPENPIEVEAISGSCMLVRTEAVKQVGLLDEGYFMHCEDLDWCMRFRQKKWKILFVPSAPVIHYKGLSSSGCPIFVEWHKHKGMVRFYRKFFKYQYSAVLMWLVIIGVWIRFCAVTANHSLLFLKNSLIAQERKCALE